MEHLISLFLIMTKPCVAQESAAVSKFIEAAAVQTGLQKEIEKSGEMLYIKIVPTPLTPYFNIGFGIGNILVTKQIKHTWEF